MIKVIFRKKIRSNQVIEPAECKNAEIGLFSEHHINVRPHIIIEHGLVCTWKQVSVVP